jgi:hypothetical protein
MRYYTIHTWTIAKCGPFLCNEESRYISETIYKQEKRTETIYIYGELICDIDHKVTETWSHGTI